MFHMEPPPHTPLQPTVLTDRSLLLQGCETLGVNIRIPHDTECIEDAFTKKSPLMISKSEKTRLGLFCIRFLLPRCINLNQNTQHG